MGDIFGLPHMGDVMLSSGLVILAVCAAWWSLTEGHALGGVFAAASLVGVAYVLGFSF